MRVTFIAILAALLLGACGGADSTPVARSASLSGTVFEVAGQTEVRSGVLVRLLETGATATTDANGSFSFGAVPTGTATLSFEPSLSALAQESGTRSTSSNSDDDDSDDDDSDDDDSDDDDSDDDDSDDDDSDDDDSDDDDSDDDDRGEDGDGNPRVISIEDGDDVRIGVAIGADGVVEWWQSDGADMRSRTRLIATADAPLGAEAKAELRSRTGSEKLEIEVEDVAPGSSYEIFLRDPAGTAGFLSIGTVTAGTDGEAELERNTGDGDTLPAGASAAEDLVGFDVEVRTPTGTVLFTGELPALPDPLPATPGGTMGSRERGKARLQPVGGNYEGEVELRRRPDRGEQRFEIEAEDFAPGTRLEFQIRDPLTGLFVTFGTQTTGTDGEAEHSTQDGAAFPLGATDVRDLEGLDVRVRLADTETTVLTGRVPMLVPDS